MVERAVWDREVEGSIPSTPTRLTRSQRLAGWRQHHTASGITKIPWPDEGAARRAAQRRTLDTGENLQWYECGWCRRWHIGHPPRPRNLIPAEDILWVELGDRAAAWMKAEVEHGPKRVLAQIRKQVIKRKYRT